jgi:NitT/TauT family transport system substrate-binding protein
MWTRMTSFAKLVVIVLIMSAVGAGLYLSGMFKPGDKKSAKSTTTSSPKKSGGLFSSNENLTVIVNTWGGFAPLAYLNSGSLTPNSESIITKEYGIDLTIKICDIFDDARNTFKSGNGDIVYATIDALPVEMGASSTMTQYGAQAFLQVDWSRDGDAIVVVKGINSVSALKGKSVAVAEGTASNTLLIKMLEANQMTMADVVLKKVSDGIEAAKLFKAGTVDAAVVWTPDDGDCLAAIPGSRILVGTKSAPFIIADALLASQTFITENKDLLVKFSTAWLTANGELNASASLRTEAAKAFAKVFNVDEGFAQNGIDKVRLTTYGDNLNFFGMNPTYVGVTGEQLYSKMSIQYLNLKLTSKPVAWRTVSNTSIIEALTLSGPNQEAEAGIKFAAPSAAVKIKEAVSSKKLSINFETGSSTLSDDNKNIIDREFAGLAKDFAGFRVRVEGNTDAVGNSQMNLTLSFQRAQAVVNYLIKEYQFDQNRFIVQGNGSKEAITAGVTSANENYRRTDFQFVNE